MNILDFVWGQYLENFKIFIEECKESLILYFLRFDQAGLGLIEGCQCQKFVGYKASFNLLFI